MADEITARTGIEISDSLIWEAEKLQPDGGRPDLEASTAKELPVVKVEAKLGAELLAGQLQSYAADLNDRSDRDTAMLVLVPKGRITEAAEVTAEALGLSGPGPWRLIDGHPSGTAIISWDELFAALRVGTSERCRYELEQLQSMYQELSSDYIAPLASDEDLRQWRSSDTDFAKLVDQVTRRLTTRHRLYPLRVESLEEDALTEPGEYRLRYVCPCARNAASCYSIGVRDSFAKWVTPIWMRVHRDTGNFRRIRERIKSSDLRSLESSGHVWIPMDVPPEVSAEHMIQALVDQAEEILRVAFP
jgi:hypothetical protein